MCDKLVEGLSWRSNPKSKRPPGPLHTDIKVIEHLYTHLHMKEDGTQSDSSWTPGHLCVMHRDDGEQLTVISSPAHQEGRGQPMHTHIHTHTGRHTHRKNEREQLKDIGVILNIKVEESLLPSPVATSYMH